MQTIMRRTVLTRHFQELATLLCRRNQDMKKLLLAALIGLSLVSVSGRASAQTVNEVTIGGIGAYTNNTTDRVFFHADKAYQPLPYGCYRFSLLKEEPHFNISMPLLLTAYVSRLPVSMSVQPLTSGECIVKDMFVG